MSEQQEQKTNSETSGTTTNRPEKPLHFHEKLLGQFQATLAERGESAYENWGMSLFHSLSDEDCEAQREALGVKPTDALDFYNRGCLLAIREDYAGAVKAFDKAIELDAGLSEALYNKALCLEKSEDKAGARKAFELYLKTVEDNEEAREIQQHISELA